MNTKDYLTKIHTHLQDRNTYKPLTYNPTSAIVNDTCTLIEYIHSQHIIDKATKAFSLPLKKTRTPLFYGLPTIHKPGCSLRPIVPGCDGPTDHLSAYVTHFIQPLASNLPSHVKDTKHFLNLIEKLPPLPPNSLLVTAVTSLYTNIPHKEGIAALIHSMAECKHLLPKLPTTPYSAHNTRFHPQTQHLQIHGHAYTPNPGYLHGNQDGSPLRQSIHGKRRTHHNPNFPPLNLLLETLY